VTPERSAAIRYASATVICIVTLAVLVRTGATQTVDAGLVERAAGFTSGRPGLLRGLELFEEVTRPVWLYAVVTPLILLTGWRARVWRRAAAAWVSLMVLWSSAALLKIVVGRPRPAAALVEASGLSFPSGHATNIAAVTVGLALLLWPLVGSRERRLLVAVGVVLTVAVVLDRVFLGVHYPSDVLAGVLYGGGFVAAASRLWPRR